MPYRLLLRQFVKTLVNVVIVAGAVFVFGLLGLLLRIPDDAIGILMPATGVALAATLLLGKPSLLGVAIGSLWVKAWAFDFEPEFIPVYAASAIGSTLSAFIGASLIRRVIGFPSSLVEGRQIILFMLLGGPVSCLIAATISISVMYGLGIITLADLPIAWLNYWISDILGVLIFTPLILIFFAEPQDIWYRRRKTVGLPIMLTFTLVTALFFYLGYVDRQQFVKQLKEKTITLSQALKNRIQLDLYSMHALKNLLLSSPLIEPQDVLLLTNQVLFSFKEIKLISWINVEEKTGETRQFISAFNEGQKNNSENLLLLPPELRKKILGSSPYTETEFLVSEKNGFKLVVPVANEINQNKQTLGIIVASIAIQDLINQALEGLNTANFSMTISTNDAATSGAKLIYTNVNKSDQASYQTIPIQVADKKWLISFFHDWGEEKSASKRQIESILYIVLWFTGILGLILLHLTGRYFRNEAIIDEHTQILTRTKVSAELANQTKNQFLANISHELRTPLNGISGFAQLLEKKSSMTVEDKKQLSIIRQCSDNLLQLINEILDISTIESHKINIEIKSFDCFKLLNDCIHMCKLKADEKGLALIMNNTCLRQNLLGDEKRIRQVLVNLIDNAIKYTDNGDVLVTASYHEDSLKIAVADSGCGIAEEDIVRIFSPFVQLSVNNFTKEGIGLGLSITQELVNLMGGELKVRSQPGLGSVFIVSLPLPIDLINNNTVVAYPQNSHAKSDQAYVLVVDDSETNLLFLVSMLEQLGCKVDFAMDGQQALALIKQNNYDLALIDINMPIMNGLELVKLIRRVKVKSKLIAVSAYADSDKINQALNAGFDSYLTKPIEEYQLVELIETSLRSRHSKT
jgi:signal transduction histidine kinase/ActR/RegA family two-component response regulator